MRLQNHHLPVVTALIAGCAAAGVTALIPIEVMENFTASSGLSEIIPQTAPPLGATARLAIGFTFAVVAAAIVLALMGGTARTAAETEETDPMSDAAPRATSLRMPRFGGVSRSAVFTDSETIEASGGDDAENWFARVKRRLDALAGRDAHGIRDFDDLPKLRSADRHPDAPPRRPIFASADLNDPDEMVADRADEEKPYPEETFSARPVPAATPMDEDQSWRPLGTLVETGPEPDVIASDDPDADDGPTDVHAHAYADVDLDDLVDRLEKRLRATPVPVAAIDEPEPEPEPEPAAYEDTFDPPQQCGEPGAVEEFAASETTGDLPPLSPRPVQAVADAEPTEPMDDMDAALQAALDTLERMNRRSA